MPYKDTKTRKEYDRKRRRRERHEVVEEMGSQKKLSDPVTIETAADIRRVVAEQIGLVREADVEVVIKARCIGYLAGVCLKAIEAGDLEGRLEALEEQLAEK